MEEEIQAELQDSETPEQEQPVEITEEVVEETAEVNETPVVDSDELARKNKELYERAKKAEAELKTLKQQKPKGDEQPTNPSPASPEMTDRLERAELRLEGYSADEVDEIMTLGGVKALNNELIKAGIEAKRKERKSLEATPTNSAKSPMYKQYTEAELRKMSSEDLEKILPR